MAIFLAILNAIAAVPSLLGYVEKFTAAIALWYFQNARNKDLQAVADAADLEMKAKTKEDRYAASDAWQRAFARDRVIS